MPSAVKKSTSATRKHLSGTSATSKHSSGTSGLVISEHLLLHGKAEQQSDSSGHMNGHHKEMGTSHDADSNGDSGIGHDDGGFATTPDTVIGKDGLESQDKDHSDHDADKEDNSQTSPAQRPQRMRRSVLYSQYDQTIYLHASKVFLSLEHEPRDDGSFESALKRKSFKSQSKSAPYIKYESEIDRVLTYSLAYSTLKYQFILEDLLEDIAFFIKYPELIQDYHLVYVIFSDYMHRKFISRELHPGEITFPEVSEVEACIVDSKVKLDAALARRRIKECARSVEDLLPSSLKVKEELSNKLLTYAWVNFHKTSMTDVIAELRSCGYDVLPASSQQVTDMFFCLDNLFDDTLVFSSDQALVLSSHRLVLEGLLVIQDKTSLFGPQSVVSLLNGSEDVLLIDYNSGASAAHVSSLMKTTRREGNIYLAGIRSQAHRREIQAKLDSLSAENVRMLDGAIDSLEPDDIRLRNVKVVLIHGQCSKTAVLDPVGFVITEGEDISILQDLSVGKPATEKINEMTRRNLTDFRYAIKFPKVQAVVYVTRSVVDAENEKIVQRAIEGYNSDESRKYPFRLTPPMFSFDSKMAEMRSNEKYYRHPPSEQANGCFLAIVSKEIEDVKEAHQAILLRANATGLLADGDSPSTDNTALGNKPQKTSSTSSKSKKNKAKKTSSLPSKRKPKKVSSVKKVAFGSTSSSNLLANVKPANSVT